MLIKEVLVMIHSVKKLPDFELDVMRIIWSSETKFHTGEIHEQLPDNKCRLQALQTILRRLEEKGFVRCEKIGRFNYYEPLVTEDEYRSQQAETLIDKLFSSSPAQLVASLVERGSMTHEDLEEIRRILTKGR
jgi:predicted transcriptional regulator